MALRGAQFAYHLGHLCVAWSDTDTNAPTKITYYWPCYKTSADSVAQIIGLDAYDEEQGVFAFKTGAGYAGTWRRVRLQDGGSTKAIDITREPIPCPTVRKGIETRWWRGRWEKYLKTGWTPA